MEAIITKYIPPNREHGARVRAFCVKGAITVDLIEAGGFRGAAEMLCECLGWTPENSPQLIAPNFANLHGGETKCGYTFVFAPLQEAA